jgi:hypothetical protein
MALAALLVASPGGAGVVPSVTMVAPYGHTQFTPSVYLAGATCGFAKTLRAPVWNSGSGVVSLAVSTKAWSCSKVPPLGQYSNEYSQAQFGLNVPLRGVTTGPHNVTVNWTLRIAAAEALAVSGTCPLPPITGSYSASYCSASAFFSVNGYAYLQDLTNGSAVYPSNYWSGFYNLSSETNSTSCYSTCYYSNSTSGSPAVFTSTINFQWLFPAVGRQSLNSHHRYIIALSFYGDCSADVSGNPTGYPSAHATALVNFGTLSNSWQLNFVQIS